MSLFRKITLAERVLKRPVSVIMVTLLITLFGLFSLSRLKVTLLPSLNIPVLAISTGYPNVNPEDLLNIVVDPLEGAVSGIEGIETIDGSVRKGTAFIILRLKDGTDIRKTELKVREAIDKVRPQLPREARDPVIFQFDPENQPIMRISVDAANRGLDELRNLAIEFIEPRLERLNGVASADTRGGLERRIYIDIDPQRLALHNLLPQEIVSALSGNNIQIPVGSVITSKQSFGVRAISMFTSIDEIEQTIIKISDRGIPLRVKDAADVSNGFKEITTLVEVNGKNSVTIEIQKQSDANTLEVSQLVEDAIQEIKSNLPEGVNLTVLSNSGSFIEDSVKNLSSSAMQALVVVVIILLLFMGGWRISFVVAMSIPISITATFAAMYFTGISLNIISITGLALAIGLLVDNSIVVSESIANRLEAGETRFLAALNGTNEVIFALLGATLTTLAVFIPILDIGGFAGAVAKDLALTICIAITISFIASIILIPVLASKLLNREEFQKHSERFKAIHHLELWYARSLKWLLFRKWIGVVFILAILGGSYFLYKTIPGEFFPESDSGEINVSIELPSGTKLIKTAEVIKNFAKMIESQPEVKTVVTSIGQRGYLQETNRGQFSIQLKSVEEREASTNAVSLRLRRMLESPGVQVRISAGGRGFGRGGFGGGAGGGIRLSLIGPEMEVLQAISNKIEATLMQDDKIISVDNGRVEPTPELVFNINRQHIAKMGSNLNEVAQNLKTQAQGSLAGQFRENGREVPIEVRTRKNTLTNRQELAGIDVLQVGDQRIPVAAVGYFESVDGVNVISRRDREIVLDVSINFDGNAMEFRQKIIDIIQSEVVLPEGYRYDFTGSTRDFRGSSQDLTMALLLALLLTYMVMAAQFENFKDPFIVMFSIPLAFFGSLVLLWITGTTLSVPANIGIVILVGIVVNNGIVMVDFIHQNTKKDYNPKTYLTHFIEAARRRLRPILLTALTTICSMIPLALEMGSGSETWSPLAKSVIGGLAFSTLLSLYIIPILLIGIDKERRNAIKVIKSEE